MENAMFESTDRDVSSRYEPILPSKPRPTIVLLHSSASSARQWERLADRLRDRFYVHAVDLHGHGARTAWRG
jgi:pimeloyl-ACP methyl ester carboxylesterase